MDHEGDGCAKNLSYFVALLFLILWLSNVETIRITQQIPPPQDSWEVVYPLFRDDVSTQLLNTQNMLGIALEEIDSIKAQNSDTQYSVDILLSELGIIQKKSDIENKRQRIENIILTILSVFAGWLLAWLAPTKETIQRISSLFFRDSPKSIETQIQNRVMETQEPNLTYWYVIRNDFFAIFLIGLIIIVAISLSITSINLLFK